MFSPRLILFSSFAFAWGMFFNGCSNAKTDSVEKGGGVVSAGAAAPAWTLRDVDGREIKSIDFAGKVVVLDFWATWCPPCRAEIPGYVELYKKYKDKGLVIVGVSVDTKGSEVVKKFMQQNGMNYPVVMADGSVAEHFGGIEAIPTTFLIDRSGHIIHQKTGAMDAAEYEAIVRAAL